MIVAHQELTGRNADYVEIYELDQQIKKARSVDEEFIEDVRRKVADAASSLRKNSLDARPKVQTCKSCDFQNLYSKAKAG